MVFAESILSIDKQEAQKHLELLGYSRGDKIFMRYIHASPVEGQAKSIKKSRLNWEECDRYQSQGYDAYFVINGGGDTDSAVKAGRAIFYEHDNLPKDIQKELWRNLGLPEPTFQVDTGGKSIHSYWVFHQPIGIGDWRELQENLLEFADGDRSIKNPSRILRLAGCRYMKGDNPGSNIASIIKASGKRYSYQELRNVIQVQKAQTSPLDSIELPVPESVPLEVCLTKRSREMLASGSTAPDKQRNDSGIELARDLIGTAAYLEKIGQTYDGNPEILFFDWCRAVALDTDKPLGQPDAIWKSAQKSNPTPGSGEDGVQACIKGWHWNANLKPTGKGFGSRRVRSGGSGGGGSGGDGGDGGDNIVPFPSVIDLTANQVGSLVDEIIEQGITGSELHAALNEISHRTPWRIDQLYKLHQQKLADVERVELRDNTREQLEALLSATNASLDLNDYLHPNFAKPLLHLASRLSLKPELYLTTLLTVASSLHHPLTRIWLSEEDDFDQPANLYSAIIAPSSQKKSPVLKAIATKPLRILQQETQREYEAQLEAYELELKEWEKAKGDDKGSPPEKPERAIHYFTKATGEGLEYQAARQPEQGMLYLSDELPAIIYGQNAYRQGKGSDKQDILSYYDGTGHTTLRAKEGVRAELDSILLSILGGIQPKVMQKLLADCEDSDGNWARFLFVNQPAVPAQLHPDGGRIDLTGLLTSLYRDINGLPQTEYTLSPDAFKLFQHAYNRYEQNRVNDPLVGMQSVWGKCEGRVGRLALNLHVINALAANQIPCEVIDAETMRKAIALTDYYAMQVKALYTEFSDSDALAPHLAKVIDLSLKRLTSSSEGWLKASDVYLSITRSQRPDGGTVRGWFTELVTLGKGEVKGSGRSLLFRAFDPKLDKIRQKLDKSSNGETTTYQEFQEKLDKLDKLDDFQKNSDDNPVGFGLDNELDAPSNSPEKEPPPERGCVGNGLLDESSNLSKKFQDTVTVGDAALDKSSNKPSNSSKLDKAIAPAPAENTPDPDAEPDYDEFPHTNPRAWWGVRKDKAQRIRLEILQIESADDYFALRANADYTRHELNWVRKNLLSQSQRDRLKMLVEAS